MTDTPDSPYKGYRPAELDDVSLYKEWQHVKEYGPTPRLEDVQAEIAERWEAIVRQECDVR